MENRTEYVIRKLLDMRQREWRHIAALYENLSFGTICKIAYGETKDPRSSTLDKLCDYFDRPTKKKKERL